MKCQIFLNVYLVIADQVKKGFMKWMFPNAHDANDNIGESLEAYYDEATKRWVFPGEDPSAADPASAPPPPMSAMPTPPPSSGTCFNIYLHSNSQLK